MATNKPSTHLSKSARKREVQELQALGEQLVGLSDEQISSMALEEKLHDAVVAAARIKSRGALRRQYQLIGKFMRDVDPEPIRLALETFQRHEKMQKKIFKQAEHWRDRIVHGELEALDEFFELTGSVSEDLTSLTKEFSASTADSVRKRLRRKIFRRVHEELTEY